MCADSQVPSLFLKQVRGATALGPALAVGLGLASLTKGAKVVVFTDGLANCGVGSKASVSAGQPPASAFFSKAAEYATVRYSLSNTYYSSNDETRDPCCSKLWFSLSSRALYRALAILAVAAKCKPNSGNAAP